MNVTSEATRRRHGHESLHTHVEELRWAAREIPALSSGERDLLVIRIVDFLHESFEPHAREEERGLYPLIAEVLGDPRSTAPMTRDHDAIRERIRELESVGREDGARLQELLYALHALISVHLWKEEIEYLPLLGEIGTRRKAT